MTLSCSFRLWKSFLRYTDGTFGKPSYEITVNVSEKVLGIIMIHMT